MDKAADLFYLDLPRAETFSRRWRRDFRRQMPGPNARPGVPVFFTIQAEAMTEHPSWTKEFPAAITVTDARGVILEMNDKSAHTFSADGGAALVGINVLDCHPEPAASRVRQLLESHENNMYTIEKSGVKKLICQMPWYRDGEFAGLVELAFEIPASMPHFVRG